MRQYFSDHPSFSGTVCLQECAYMLILSTFVLNAEEKVKFGRTTSAQEMYAVRWRRRRRRRWKDK